METTSANAKRPINDDSSKEELASFSSNTGEGSASSAQGGRNHGAINRHPPLKPPGTINTATKHKTKSKETKYTFINHGSQLHYPVEL